MDKIKVSAVNYLNTKPFLYGIQSSSSLMNLMDLSLNIPSECASMLQAGEIDLGLVPIAVIPHLNESHIISDYCIGANGAVKSVYVYSFLPIFEVKTIILDYHSKTSSLLTKILAKKLWHIQPHFIDGTSGYESLIEKDVAGLVIGDRAIEQNPKYPYSYDLAEEWKKLTNLPFVFAAWISNKKLPLSFITQFNKAIDFGIKHKEQAIREVILQKYNGNFDVEDYLKNRISYELDEKKKSAIKLFLTMIREL